MSHEQYLGKVLVLRDAQGGLVGVGRCMVYCDAPTVMIETSDGKKIHWRADMANDLHVEKDVLDVLFPIQKPPTLEPINLE